MALRDGRTGDAILPGSMREAEDVAPRPHEVGATSAASRSFGSNQTGPIELALPVEGMTCASCVNRIERFLNKTPGVVDASVNLATERATVHFDPAVAGRAELVAAIEAAGYDVRQEPPQGATTELAADDAEERQRASALRGLGVRSVVSIAVALAIMALMFWPGRPLTME